MFEAFHTRHVHTPTGVTVHAKVSVGTQGPPVLLLHGYPQNLFLWARVAPLLAPHFTVVCADLRGYGDSSKPPGSTDHSNYSFRALAEDQVELMRALGHERFHVIGHDRGARTAHRMALDHAERVLSLAILDIVPTHVMFTQVNPALARAYWHWYFLQQPAPYPEQVIGSNPDVFYEGCLFGWGATGLSGFDAVQLAAYRKSWHDPAAIHGSCCDYRAAGTVDLALDTADPQRQVQAPALVVWGSEGLMHRHFDVAATWAPRLARMQTATLPGGHFFIDQMPGETAALLLDFLRPLAQAHPP
jgi:haloacetate dehalogenase